MMNFSKALLICSLLSAPEMILASANANLSNFSQACVKSADRNVDKTKHFNRPSSAQLCDCMTQNFKCAKLSKIEINFLTNTYSSDSGPTESDSEKFETLLNFDLHIAQSCTNNTKFLIPDCKSR